MSQKIELDPENLTLADWEVLEAIQEGQIKVKAAVEIITRCSNWTAEDIRALPASALFDVVAAIADALKGVIAPKN